MWIVALLLSTAWGACPEETVTADQVGSDLDILFTAYTTQEVDTYVAAFSILEMHMACVEEVLPPETAERYLQLHGIHQLILAAPEQSALFFQGALFANPDSALSEDVRSSGMGEPEAWAMAIALPAPQPTKVPELPGATIRVNGKEGGVRPEGAPAILQVVLEDGAIHWTGMISTTEELPKWLVDGDLAAGGGYNRGLLGANDYQMLHIEPGTFLMGSGRKEKGRDADETQHEVTLTRGFVIGAVEVTQGLWEAVMGSNRSGSRNRARPVDNVTWLEVVAFCNKLSTLEGLQPVYTVEGPYDVRWDRDADGYRLPTEAEWEYAARANQPTRYAGGDKLKEIAWSGVAAGGRSHETRRLAPNAWGLYDMTGNLFEWVWDFQVPYTEAAQTDPSGPEEGSFRVYRGGAYTVTKGADLRIAERKRAAPEVNQANLGFRLARTAK